MQRYITFISETNISNISFNIIAHAWGEAKEHCGLYFEMNECFYKELPEKGFSFPFPQLDVHLSKE